MGCPSAVTLGNNLVFSVTVHDPATGILTDADAVPAWRLYEDETAVPILTGVMAKLDDVNTTGFYTELIACTSANGFEGGKTYTLYVTAAVGGDTGGICYGFNVNPSLIAGANAMSYLLTSSLTGLPIEGAEIWITTDLPGLNVIWSGTTDAFGIARDAGNNLPWLDNGTYYVWRKKAGYSFSNPDTETIP